MKQEVKTAPMARESSFINLLSGWVQQGVENFFATQRILVDLAMRQNGTVIDVMREKLTAPDFQPVAVAKEFAGEGLANFIEGQKLLLGLAQRESEILATGVKERIGGYAVTDALINTIHRSMDTFVEMQLEYLKNAGKQVHERLAAVKAGEEYDGDTLVELARGGLENFVQAQKKFLHVVAEETSRMTGRQGSHGEQGQEDGNDQAGAGSGRYVHRSAEEVDGRGCPPDPCQPEGGRNCGEDDADGALS